MRILNPRPESYLELTYLIEKHQRMARVAATGCWFVPIGNNAVWNIFILVLFDGGVIYQHNHYFRSAIHRLLSMTADKWQTTIETQKLQLVNQICKLLDFDKPGQLFFLHLPPPVWLIDGWSWHRWGRTAAIPSRRPTLTIGSAAHMECHVADTGHDTWSRRSIGLHTSSRPVTILSMNVRRHDCFTLP